MLKRNTVSVACVFVIGVTAYCSIGLAKQPDVLPLESPLDTELWRPQASSGQIADFRSDGKVVAAIKGAYVYIWKLPSGELIETLRLPVRDTIETPTGQLATFSGDACDVQFSPDGKWLAVTTCFTGKTFCWQISSNGTIASERIEIDGDILRKALAEAADGQVVLFPRHSVTWSNQTDQLFVHVRDALFLFRRQNTCSLQLNNLSAAKLLPTLMPHQSWSVLSSTIKANEGGFDALVYDHSDAPMSVVTRFTQDSDDDQMRKVSQSDKTLLSRFCPNSSWSLCAGVGIDRRGLGFVRMSTGKTLWLDPDSHWDHRLAWTPDGKVLAASQRASTRWPKRKDLSANAPPERDPFKLLEDDKRERELINVPAGLTLWDVDSRRTLGRFDYRSLTVDVCVGNFSPDAKKLLVFVNKTETRKLVGRYEFWDVSKVLSSKMKLPGI